MPKDDTFATVAGAASAEIEPLSKTKQKKQMTALQDLGERLTTLSPASRSPLALPATLEAELKNFTKMKANGAKKRQLQYIGRLMRELDASLVHAIRDFFATIDGNNQVHAAYLKRLEQTRERLFTDESYLTEYIELHPNAEVGRLRALLRAAKKEADAAAPKRAYREILRYLRALEPYTPPPHSEEDAT